MPSDAYAPGPTRVQESGKSCMHRKKRISLKQRKKSLFNFLRRSSDGTLKNDHEGSTTYKRVLFIASLLLLPSSMFDPSVLCTSGCRPHGHGHQNSREKPSIWMAFLLTGWSGVFIAIYLSDDS